MEFDEYLRSRGGGDMIRLYLIKLLEISFEDWLNYCSVNKTNKKICDRMLGYPDEQGYVNQENNKIWYKKWKSINPANKYGEYDPSKFYHSEFIKEWKKVGCNPYNNVTKECLDKNSKRGHLGNVKYLIEQGVEPDINTLYSAIDSKNLDIVKYLVETKNVKYNKYDVYIAGMRGSNDIYNYLADYLFG